MNQPTAYSWGGANVTPHATLEIDGTRYALVLSSSSSGANWISAFKILPRDRLSAIALETCPLAVREAAQGVLELGRAG